MKFHQQEQEKGQRERERERERERRTEVTHSPYRRGVQVYRILHAHSIEKHDDVEKAGDPEREQRPHLKRRIIIRKVEDYYYLLI